MVHVIVGEKGKGKTKVLLEKANTAIKEAKGNVAYLDKSNKNMYELNNKIRLINVKDYLVENASEFLGFICGIVSQDNDLEKVFLDSFLKVACINPDQMESVIQKLESISKQFNIEFIVSISVNKDALPSTLADKVIAAV